MSQVRDPPRSNGSPPSRPLGQQTLQPPPLVIVSERGRHSAASRRIVRAQAARASAAQSRETRARNREDRTVREGPQSPPRSKQPSTPPSSRPNLAQPVYVPTKPLVNWITNILQLSTASFIAGAAVLAATGQPRLIDVGNTQFNSAVEGFTFGGEQFSRRLPLALPRGFVSLQQRLQISDAFLAVISRTACFDFASPGVQDRLNQLLFDIVMASAAAGMSDADASFHPIHGHLRIACTCLTIFQAQRADGAPLGLDPRYNSGLEAALAEARLLELESLREPKTAEAALWAIFIISVTTGAAVTSFQQTLCTLMSDLQLGEWAQVRGVLLDFIYPGSCLDEPCRRFFDHLRQQIPVIT